MSHRLGLNTIKKTGESPITGDVELTAGSNVTLTQDGNAITIAASGGGEGGASDWGDIGGTLSDQTDLQAALDNKADDDSVMHLSGDEEIAGNKTFLDDIYADNVYATLLGLSTKYATFDTTETESIGFGFKNNNVLKAALSLYTGNNDFFVDIYDDEGTKVTATTWNGEAGLMTLFPNNPEMGVAIGKGSASELLDVNGNIVVSGRWMCEISRRMARSLMRLGKHWRANQSSSISRLPPQFQAATSSRSTALPGGRRADRACARVSQQPIHTMGKGEAGSWTHVAETFGHIRSFPSMTILHQDESDGEEAGLWKQRYGPISGSTHISPRHHQAPSRHETRRPAFTARSAIAQ